MILAKLEPCLGILIEYDTGKKIDFSRRKSRLKLSSAKHENSAVNIGFIGAGSYAQGYLLPNISKNKSISLKGVMTETGTSSRSVAERFGFEFCTTNAEDIIENDEINTIFIATRHDSHARYVLEALRAGKHVFVEKPLCIKIEELEEIQKCYDLSAMSHQLLMVGYNRRFSPMIQKIRSEFGEGPKVLIYRVNAGIIPTESWIQDPESGGGRIIGEICHFVDTLTFLSGSLPVSVHAEAMDDQNNMNDTINVTITYQNGSLGTIFYLTNGDKCLPKEHVEVFAHGATAILDDFKILTIYSHGKKKRKKHLSQDKGQKEEIRQVVDAILKGAFNLITFEEIYSASLITFKITESIRTGERIKI
jgi:polar amino acid transport system substrate-binding protein